MVVFVRNLFTGLAFVIIQSGQQFGKNEFQRTVNGFLIMIPFIYCFNQLNYKKIIFVELIFTGLIILYTLFTGDNVIIKELNWYVIAFCFFISFILFSDSIEEIKREEERKKLEEEEDV